MTHRVDQILVAAKTAITSLAGLTLPATNVFNDRTLTLSDDVSELPAISINEGDDQQLIDTGTDNFSFIDSLLAVECISVAKESDERTCALSLRSLRRQIHKALMVDQTLGLGFVMATRYAGAQKPEFDISTDAIVGSQLARWLVLYRMNVTDPGDG